MTKTKILSFFALIVCGLSFSTASANSYPAIPPVCSGVNGDLRFGARDNSSNTNVSRLQNLLNQKGYLSVSATGYFGPMTLRAVQAFQSENNLYSAGFVGPLTREKINLLICGSQTNSPTISSVSPSSGVIGSTVNVYGSNFVAGSHVNFGTGYAEATFISSGQIQFTIPSAFEPACAYSNPRCMMLVASREVTLGTYAVSVENTNNTSNSVNFTVTSLSVNNNTPVISGIGSPTVLNVDQSGTWTVRATDVTGGGLSYNVVWGDEVYAPMVASSNTSSSYAQTSTFTHTYHSSGVYTPRFYVKGSNGQSVSTSVSVTVNANNQNYIPVISSVSPTSVRVGDTVYIYGTNFDKSADTVLLGGGVVSHRMSYDGKILEVTIPQYVSPDCRGEVCTTNMISITPGTYNISVRNSWGTSNAVSFTVAN